jgi:hypothetical protein
MWISSAEKTYVTHLRALDDGYNNIIDYELSGALH